MPKKIDMLLEDKGSSSSSLQTHTSAYIIYKTFTFMFISRLFMIPYSDAPVTVFLLIIKNLGPYQYQC
jgi:hypothetical protein